MVESGKIHHIFHSRTVSGVQILGSPKMLHGTGMVVLLFQENPHQVMRLRGMGMEIHGIADLFYTFFVILLSNIVFNAPAEVQHFICFCHYVFLLISDQAHGLGNFQIHTQYVDSLLSEDSQQLSGGVVFNDLMQLLQGKAGCLGNGRQLNLC